MTSKDSFLIAYTILRDTLSLESGSISREEGDAIKTTMAVLARLFTNETMYDILLCMGIKEKGKECFDEEVMARIKSYNAHAEKSLG